MTPVGWADTERTTFHEAGGVLQVVQPAGPSEASPSVIHAPWQLSSAPLPPYLDLEMRVDPLDASYDYSKLYFATTPDEPFDETRVVCFKLRRSGEFETVRLRLPDAARATGWLRLRVDALGYTPGRVEARTARLGDGSDDAETTRIAELLAQKERVRRDVERSERERLAVLPHYPESLSLELTAGCNLTCTHCSSHGDAAEHRLNNFRPAIDPAMLERLAHELFTHLTVVNLVGRGEPTMVSQSLWDLLTRLLDRYRVLMVCVTNGLFITRRFTPAVMPLIDTVVVSIDGTTPEVFALNRGGASLQRVLANVAAFHELRQSLPLVRRPRLGFSWTLKRNNIHQFPDFIRMVLPFDPALLYVRHQFVFREKDRDQSLIGEPEQVNRWLREAYALLEGTRIKLDVPPLMMEGAAQN